MITYDLPVTIKDIIDAQKPSEDMSIKRVCRSPII